MRRLCLAAVGLSLPLAAALAWVQGSLSPRASSAAPREATSPATATDLSRPQRASVSRPGALSKTLSDNLRNPDALAPSRRDGSATSAPRSRRIPPAPPRATPCETPTPDLLARGQTVEPRYRGDTSRRAVALTFDDGPSAENTPSVLRTLAHSDTPATFFVLGERVEKMPALTARIAQDGHELGNHTWSHTSLRSLFKSQIHSELCRTSAAIQTAAGVRPTRFRPPFGRYPQSALPLLAALGFDVELWSVDGDDWKHDDPEAMAAAVVRAAHPGAIILLHDRERITARALPSIIGGLRARGFEIVPLAEL